MFIWVLRVHGMGLLSALLALAVVTRFVDRRLMPGGACMAGAVMGFCGWLVFVIGPGVTWSSQAESLTAIVWEDWVALASLIVPLEAGLLGWLGTASIWRWFFLGAGLVAALPPWLWLPNLGTSFFWLICSLALPLSAAIGCLWILGSTVFHIWQETRGARRQRG